MLISLGIPFAFAALFLWGGGDFLIQRSIRRIGDWEALFLICLFGTIILLPFVYGSFLSYLSSEKGLIVLSLASAVVLALLV
jgi:hypothetical protein